MKDYHLKRHCDCQLSIRWKLFKGDVEPTPALVCRDHNEFIQWLTHNIAYELIDVDRLPVEPYTKLSKPKQNKKRQKVSI
jgi:hypothetical protein